MWVFCFGAIEPAGSNTEAVTTSIAVLVLPAKYEQLCVPCLTLKRRSADRFI
jgi:hypothetical protein